MGGRSFKAKAGSCWRDTVSKVKVVVVFGAVNPCNPMSIVLFSDIGTVTTILISKLTSCPATTEEPPKERDTSVIGTDASHVAAPHAPAKLELNKSCEYKYVCFRLVTVTLVFMNIHHK